GGGGGVGGGGAGVDSGRERGEDGRAEEEEDARRPQDRRGLRVPGEEGGDLEPEVDEDGEDARKKEERQQPRVVPGERALLRARLEVGHPGGKPGGAVEVDEPFERGGVYPFARRRLGLLGNRRGAGERLELHPGQDLDLGNLPSDPPRAIAT